MGKRTIILIAHRLTTVKSAKQIFLLEKGALTASGSYERLFSRNETFRRMAGDVEGDMDARLTNAGF